METLILIGVHMNTKKGLNMAKLTEEEKIRREEEKEAKRIAREIEYHNCHFYCKETTIDKNGKEVIVKYPVGGYYTNDSVTFNWDSNNYVVLVDSHKEIKDDKNNIIGHKPHTKQYTRCKESSKNYYYKGKLLSASKSTNNKIADSVTTGMTIEEIIAKAPNAKGFRLATNARLLECVECAKSNADTVYRRYIDGLNKKSEANATQNESAA